MNRSDSPLPPPRELTDAEERAIDALLAEVYRPRGPDRDFTAELLSRLDAPAIPVRLADRPAAESASRHRAAVVTALTVAAAILVAVFFNLPQRDRLQVAGNAEEQVVDSSGSTAASGGPGPVDAGHAETSEEIAGNSPERPVREPVLLSGEPQAGEASGSASDSRDVARSEAAAAIDTHRSGPNSSAPNSPSGTSATLADFDRQFRQYWQAVGVTPAPQLDRQQWAARVGERFGVRLPIAEADDDTAVEAVAAAAFADSEAAAELAKRLLDRMFAGLPLEPDRRDAWVEEASQIVASGGPFDVWFSRRIADDSLAAQTTPEAARIAQWLSDRVLGCDARCAKCHDSPIDSRYAQRDFWSLAASLTAPDAESVFYELPDGRQQVASASVPLRWFGLRSGDAADEPVAAAAKPEIASLVVGNREFAKSLANHLWTIGFDMPLTAAASSPAAPPRDESLDRALEMLADRLLASNFDVRDAARWVIASDPMRRSMPPIFDGDNWRTADESTLAAAALAQRAFAARKPALPSLGADRLAMMMQSRGGGAPLTLQARDALLAQPRTVGPSARRPAERSGRNATPAEEHWWAQWIGDREGLRGGWLESIGDFDEQVRHAFYAIGQDSPGRRRLEAAREFVNSMQAADEDDNAAMRLFWILQNTD